MTEPKPEDLDFLAHYGVKGMKWGVRRERDSIGRRSGSSSKKEEELSPLEQKVVSKLAPLGYTEENMRRAFGSEPKKVSPPPPEKSPRLTPAQKKILIGVGGAAVVGLAAYGLHRAGVKNQAALEGLLEKGDGVGFATEWQKMLIDKTYAETHGYDSNDILKFSTTGLKLDPGSIVKRVSMSRETDIRDNFFASVDDADVDRYKAILPVYWKQWTGKRNPDGFVVSLKANGTISAPSQRDTLNIFKAMLDDDFTLPSDGRRVKLRNYLKGVYGQGAGTVDDDTLAARYLHEFAGQWNNSENVFTARMFERVKQLGFNAIPDMNDAKNLANSPHIFLDKSLFEIAGHEYHGPSDIRRAQELIVELVHNFIGEIMDNPLVKDLEFLSHYGVKGMQWGVRRAERGGVSRKIDREARKDAEETARAKQFYGEGAGTRRKLAKATAEGKMKRSADYKKAYERHLAEQDSSKHATKAKKERETTDKRLKRKQRVGYVARRLTGEMGTQAAFVAAGIAGAAFLNSPKGRSLLNKGVKTARSSSKNLIDTQKAKKGAAYLSDYFQRNG